MKKSKKIYTSKKSLGQHFIINPEICRNICNLCNIKDQNILEIGPGRGDLTSIILENKPKKLFAIEIDNHLEWGLKILKGNYNNFDYIIDDALKYTLDMISKTYFNSERFNIISNLPYNVGTTLFINWHLNSSMCDDIVIMLQEEVVDRICAKKNTKAYGKISVLSQYIMNVNKEFIVFPQEFHIPPKVNSAILKGNLYKNINSSKYDLLKKILNISFHNRRKILRSKLIDFQVNESFLNKRAEDLSLDDFLGIVDYNI